MNDFISRHFLSRKLIAFSVSIESRWNVGMENVNVLTAFIKDSQMFVGENR